MKKILGFSAIELIISVCVILFTAHLSFTYVKNYNSDEKTVERIKSIYTQLGEVVREQNYLKPVSKWGWNEGNIAISSNAILHQYILPSFPNAIDCSNPLNCVGGFMSMNGEDYTNFRQDENYARAIIGKERAHIALVAKQECKQGNLNSLCALIYVDVDNKSGNNKLGDDVFVFGLYGSGNVMPYGYNFTREKINEGCNKNAYGETCAAKIMKDDWRITYRNKEQKNNDNL